MAATILLVFSGLALAFTEPIAALIVDLLGGGQGDWDPKRRRYVSFLNQGQFDKSGLKLTKTGPEHCYRNRRICVLLLGLCAQRVSYMTVTFTPKLTLQSAIVSPKPVDGHHTRRTARYR